MSLFVGQNILHEFGFVNTGI